MLGYIREAAKFARPCEGEICGLPLVIMDVSPGQSIRWKLCWRRGLRELRRKGVNRAVMPPDLWDLAARWGIQPAREKPLRRMKLPELLDCLEREVGTDLSRETVRLRAERADAAVCAAAELLVRRVRYVDIAVERGGEALFRQLRERYGLSACGKPAAAELSFNSATGDVPALLLGKDCEREQKISWEIARSQTQDREELPGGLAVELLRGRKLKSEEITVKSVAFRA